ncbi:MAG: hypothetical protein JNL98_13540 [Bryobacterales bacterium]|nr:hypothetical protein [Bryobacterales bacterium]
MLFRLGFVAIVVTLLFFWRGVLFVGGGGLVSVGHMVQGFVHGFDYRGTVGTPQEILDTVILDNQQSSKVEGVVGGPSHKPEVMAVMCMDPRINSEVVLGDSRHYYDVVRLPGSVLSEEVIEAIELGVKEHRLKVVLFTTHTDCAMEKVAHSEEAHEYPALSKAVDKREEMYQLMLKRPMIADRLKAGTLLIKRYQIDTPTGKLTPQ